MGTFEDLSDYVVHEIISVWMRVKQQTDDLYIIICRGVTICIFVLNRSVRGLRFGMHYKPNDSLDKSYYVWKIKELKVCEI